MRPRTVCVGTRDPACSHQKSTSYYLHEVLNIRYSHFSQAHDIDFLLRILSTLQKFPIVYEVEEFPAVNFVERNNKTQVLELDERLHDITGGHQIQAWDLPIASPHHSVSLPATSLSICKASCVCTFECATY